MFEKNGPESIAHYSLEKAFKKYEKSRLTIGAYCYRNGISQGQFYYWRKKLKARTAQELHTFKEIEVIDLPTVVQIRIIFGHGVSLEIEGFISPGYIRQLAGARFSFSSKIFCLNQPCGHVKGNRRVMWDRKAKAGVSMDPKKYYLATRVFCKRTDGRCIISSKDCRVSP